MHRARLLVVGTMALLFASWACSEPPEAKAVDACRIVFGFLEPLEHGGEHPSPAELREEMQRAEDLAMAAVEGDVQWRDLANGIKTYEAALEEADYDIVRADRAPLALIAAACEDAGVRYEIG